MDGFDAVVEEPEIDAGTEVDEQPIEGEGGEPTEPVEPAEGQTTEPDSPYTTKFSREMRAALKAWEAANPESAKYAKQARDNHARLFALTQLEPKGIDGVREKYALLDSLAMGDAKGIEAVTAMQEQLAGVEEVDSLLAAGDPRAFDALGEDFNDGLVKLTPAYLDRVRQTNPQAFEAAIAPHVVDSIAKSEFLETYNRGVDEMVWILNGRTPDKLSDDELRRYALAAHKVVAGVGTGINALGQKAGELKQNATTTNPQDEIQQARTELEKERQQIHWDTRIKPLAVQHENQTFNQLFDPYQKRLRLDEGAKADLLQAFKAGLNRAGSSDKEYLRQMKIYQGQKNPDPVAVANFVKNAINKHSKTVMEGLIKARYSPFLNGKPKTAPVVNGTKPKGGPVGPNVEVRTVKPPMEEIDHRNTPVEWLAMKQYRLYNGKVVRVQSVR